MFCYPKRAISLKNCSPTTKLQKKPNTTTSNPVDFGGVEKNCIFVRRNLI